MFEKRLVSGGEVIWKTGSLWKHRFCDGLKFKYMAVVKENRFSENSTCKIDCPRYPSGKSFKKPQDNFMALSNLVLVMVFISRISISSYLFFVEVQD